MGPIERDIRLKNGLRDNKIIDIHELSVAERGKACHCVCPNCGKPLIAKMGKKKQWHFAHEGEACDIAVAQQTALHMLAKEIIEESKRLLFPGISIDQDGFMDAVEDYRVKARIPQTVEYRKDSVVTCDSVTLERKLSNIVPDIIVTVKGRCCLIEIAVTHFVDEEKEKKIREIGLPLFEIDLSGLFNSTFSKKELTEEVLYNPNNRTWIFNPLFDNAEKWAKNEYLRLILSAEEKVEREDKEEAKRKEKRQQRRAIGEKRIKGLFEPDNYQKSIEFLKNEKETVKQLKKLHLKTEIDNLPFYLSIPITGEMVFPCDRRIWQSALFDKFIFNRNSKDEANPTVHIEKVQKWIKAYNKQFPVDWELTYKTAVSISHGEKKSVSLLYDVVVTFFNYLVFLGFLTPLISQEADVRQTHSLEPPNKEHAAILYEAINKVDKNEPTVDDEIVQLLSQVGGNTNIHLQRNQTVIINEMENKETLIPKMIWEERKKEIESERVSGLEDVQEKDFDGEEPIYDRFNCRWLRCTKCGRIIRADQMASYGGRGRVNKGICRECSNTQKKRDACLA